MGFSVKLAPGVRVRASSRGVRTSLGPRVARVHVGAGRTGFSTGVGPVGFYTSAGRGRSRSASTAAANRQLVAAVRQQVVADKAAEAKALADALVAITEIHRAEFPPAARPIAPEAPRVDTAEIIRRHRKSAKQATSLFARRSRKSALTQSAVDAQEEMAAGEARAICGGRLGPLLYQSVRCVELAVVQAVVGPMRG
ncbi:DUF4236 domain-containing protein [Kribbella sp. NBC_01484]|uniref:DUF4236 domain-containing protein n=1 Tax=Kribbella sp. NBC_01484 TaxID=2903579 RepID=UPI003FA58B76